MAQNGTPQGGFYRELRRRHVVRTTVAYAAVVFGALQLAEILFPAFTADSEALIRLLTVGAVLLFPVVVMVAWVYEITPMGIRSMARMDAEAGIDGHHVGLAPRLAFLAVTLAAVGGAAAWWWSGAESVPGSLSFRGASVFQGAQTTDASGPIGSLAVLPLEDLSPQDGQEYFAPGMHEAVISELSQLGTLRVISRTSVVQYAPGGRSIPQIGRDLGVDAIVEGSVLRAEGRVRITVQLIHAASDTHLWAQSYERDLQDVITLQREVAQAIAAEIQRRLDEREGPEGGEEPRRLAGADPVAGSAGAAETGSGSAGGEEREAGPTVAGAAPASKSVERGVLEVPGSADGGEARREIRVVPLPAPPEVQEAAMRGRVSLLEGSREGAEKALVFFREALSGDSAFAPALAGLAGAYLAQGFEGPTPDLARLDSALSVARKAVAADPRSPEAQEVLRTTQEALQAIQGSELEFVHVTAPATSLGQFVQEGLASLEVHQGEPGDVRLRVRAFLRLMAGGRLHEAAGMGRDLLDDGVDDLVLWEGMEHVLRLEDDVQGMVELRSRRREVRGAEPGPSVRELLRALDQDGVSAYWRWKAREHEAREAAGAEVFWTSVATTRMALGDSELALDALERAAAEREPLLAALRHDPVWDPVRSDPRYQEVLRTLRTEGPAPGFPSDPRRRAP